MTPLAFSTATPHTWSLTYTPIGADDGQITAVFDVYEFLGFAIEGPSAEGFYIYPCYRTQVDGGSRGSIQELPRIYPDSQTREWTLNYDPGANSGGGEIQLVCSGVTAVLPLGAGHKAMGARFNRFRVHHPLDRWQRPNGLL